MRPLHCRPCNSSTPPTPPSAPGLCRYSYEIDRTRAAEVDLQKAKAKFGKKLYQVRQGRGGVRRSCTR